MKLLSDADDFDTTLDIRVAAILRIPSILTSFRITIPFRRNFLSFLLRDMHMLADCPALRFDEGVRAM